MALSFWKKIHTRRKQDINMNRRKTQLICILSGIVFVIFVLLCTVKLESVSKILLIPDATDVNAYYLVDTVGCKIPKMDPFDATIENMLSKGSELTCAIMDDLLFANASTIYINWSVVRQSLPSLKYCNYDVIWRPYDVEMDHNYYQFVNKSESFTTNVTVNHEFVRVNCFDQNDRLIHTNAFSFVPTKSNVEARCEKNYIKLSNQREHLSIVMLGIYSVSRNNMIRYMPQTRKYLLQNMSAVEFLGYNKVKDNTYVNIVPMTTGKYVDELPWNYSGPYDNYDFIWKTYSDHGYRTLYSEDAPNIQIFDYLAEGFRKPSADYFNRHFTVAIENMPIWNSEHHCLHGRPETSILLDYLKAFVTKFKSSPYFAFSFISRLTHDVLESTRKADILYRNFVEGIHSHGILNNTILIFYSDHGIRYGKIRETYIGKLEERLPFIFLVFPPWFKTKYPIFYKNLITNSNRLTTPFDIFETLNHILFLGNYSRNEGRGQSVFYEISGNRTCSDVDILPHWCTCLYQENLLNDSIVHDIAVSFMLNINSKLDKYKQCEILKLKRVMSASILTSSKEISKNTAASKTSYYQVTIQTSPGDAIFEGTLYYQNSSKSIEIGDLSRINMYSTTSHCVNDKYIKRLCFCKQQLYK